MTKFSNIIFLDEEGTGLSPYADVLMKVKMQKRGIWGFNVFSKGNVVLFPEPVNQKIQELAMKKGVSLLDYKAQELSSDDFSENTLILSFDAASKQKVYDRFQNAANVYTIREYVGETGDIRLPMGGSLEEYEAVCAVVDRVTDRILEKITFDR